MNKLLILLNGMKPVLCALISLGFLMQIYCYKLLRFGIEKEILKLGVLIVSLNC